MTVENISWSISTKECCRPRRGLNPRPPGLQSDGASNWATEAGQCILTHTLIYSAWQVLIQILISRIFHLSWASRGWWGDMGKKIWLTVFPSGNSLISPYTQTAASVANVRASYVWHCENRHIQTASFWKYILSYTDSSRYDFFYQQHWYFSYFSMKTCVMSTHWNRLSEAITMSIQNVGFQGEIRKTIIWLLIFLQLWTY